MISSDRFLKRIVTSVIAVSVIGACVQSLPTTAPSTPLPSSTASPSPTASASASALVTASPTTVPTASPTAVLTPCPVAAQDGNLPSDRLIDVDAATGPGADRMIFHFGNTSLPGPGGIPTGELTLAAPPYTFGPSGLPIEMAGERVLQLVFRQMTLSNDLGEIVYAGPAELEPDFPAFRHAVEYDESEGVIGWYLGYDGPGCITLTRNGNDLTVAFEHE